MVHAFEMCQGIRAGLVLTFNIPNNAKCGLSPESFQHPKLNSHSINLNSILNKTERFFF